MTTMLFPFEPSVWFREAFWNVPRESLKTSIFEHISRNTQDGFPPRWLRQFMSGQSPQIVSLMLAADSSDLPEAARWIDRTHTMYTTDSNIAQAQHPIIPAPNLTVFFSETPRLPVTLQLSMLGPK